MANVASGQRSILWLQVLGLAAVQGAISLSWVIYNLYLPELLTGLGFAAGLAAVLLIIENALGTVMEPLMGSLSDRQQHWLGSRFPQIALGMILAAVCFIALPLIVLVGGQGLRSLLPPALVAWALTMTIFRSPALSLLGRYAYEAELPQAASVLTLVGGVTGAMAPLANEFILGLGPVAAFGAGSGVLLLAALVLSRVKPGESTATAERAGQPLRWQNLPCIFITGAAIAMGLRLMLGLFPKVVAATGFGQPPLVVGLLFITVAVSALPCGQLATKVGNIRAMVAGLGLMALLALLMSIVATPGLAVLMAIAIGISFSLIGNGTLPYALSMVPPDKAGLGTGLYFSGGGAALALLGSLISNWGPGLSLTVAIAAFAIAALCITLKRP